MTIPRPPIFSTRWPSSPLPVAAAAPAGINDSAHAVRFLCHPDSGLTTGEVLMVDGGWTLA
jgi:NAD(P)-dependent dehydrogenase (short-subunit alcohol dehydrogenase family)